MQWRFLITRDIYITILGISSVFLFIYKKLWGQRKERERESGSFISFALFQKPWGNNTLYKINFSCLCAILNIKVNTESVIYKFIPIFHPKISLETCEIFSKNS